MNRSSRNTQGDNVSDDQVFRDAAAGNTEAWNTLINQHSRLVWTIARAHGLSVADTEEVCETTWLKFAETISLMRQPARVAAWLSTAARDEALRVLRARDSALVSARRRVALDGRSSENRIRLNKALMATANRAETRIGRLSRSFVEVEALEALLRAPTHQVLFGRRGTGKSHVLHVLRHIVEQNGDLGVLIDMRTIGARAGRGGGSEVPYTERAASLLLETMEVLERSLTQSASSTLYGTDLDFSECMGALDSFADELDRVGVHAARERSPATDLYGATSIDMPIPRPILGSPPSATAGDSRYEQIGSVTEISIEALQLNARPLADALAAVVGSLPVGRAWIIFDSWNAVARDLQPLLAEFVRVCLLPVSGVTVTIGAIEQRSRFSENPSELGEYLGLEFGRDILHVADLDRFARVRRRRDAEIRFIEDLIFQHVRAVDPGLATRTTAVELIDRVFLARSAFTLFVDASAGVPRDALNVIRIAAQRARHEPISMGSTRDAVKAWYVREKLASIAGDARAQATYRDIVSQVDVESRNDACFLLHNSDFSKEDVARLFDARLLHVVEENVPAHIGDSSAQDFTLCRLDAGMYVDQVSENNPSVSAEYSDEALYPVIVFPWH